MKKTKIVCTMGPNTNDVNLLKELALNGMNIARFNFSHGDHEEQLGRVKNVRQVRQETGLPIAMLLDTKGPEIRSGILKDGEKVSLHAGDKFTITTEQIVGDNTITSVSYEGLVDDVKVGDRILIDDGLIELLIEEVAGKELHCTILNGGELGEKKGVNVPNVSIKLPALTEKDKSDILFGIEQGYDFIAASFVRNAAAVKQIRDILDANNSKIRIISKIENAEGIENIDEIIELSDGIMVARGDMGVEIPAQEVPHIQKMIIQKCNAAHKPVITATQMLDSMMRNPRPTRAEVTDVANAILDGTDAIMLSGETAMGKYPVEAVKMMTSIAEETEQYLDYHVYRERNKESYSYSTANAVSQSASMMADALGAKVILAPTMSGFTAHNISNWRPETSILALSPNADVVQKLQIAWGVTAVQIPEQSSTEDVIDSAIAEAKKIGAVEAGDLVVVTVGTSEKSGQGKKGTTNALKVVTVE